MAEQRTWQGIYKKRTEQPMSKKKFIFARALYPETKKQTDKLFTEGIDRGNYIGFDSLTEYYNVKLGCTTYIGGIPAHGKTEFLFEILMNMSEFYGWKHLLFTPETGTPAEIIGELAHKFIGKPFIKNDFQMSETEKYQADAYLDEFFTVVDAGEGDMTIDDLLRIASDLKKEIDVKTLSIDPWNELKHDFEIAKGREDKYLEYMLGKIRRFARENKMHIFIVAHPRTLRPLDGKYEAPTAFELSGGAAWYSKAESILCIHRPGIESTAVEIHIQKVKPKHIGKKGMIGLFFDWQKSRYYEVDLNNEKKYAHPQIIYNTVKPINFYEKENE